MIVLLEIFLDNLPKKNSKNVSKTLLKTPFQSTYRDFAFVVDDELLARELVNVIKM